MKITETDSLYHYCKLSTAIEFILPEKRLLLNTLGRTNDPRENKSFVFAGLNFDPDKINILDHSNVISQEIRKDCKILCLSGDSSPYFGYELSRMWAMYGDNHKGVCVEISKERFINKNADKIKGELFKPVTYYELDVSKPIYHKEIDYERIDRVGLTVYVRNEFRVANMDYLFFTKNKEWETEQEVRLVYFSDVEANEYCTIDGCIKNIYLGVDFNEHYLPAIRTNSQKAGMYKVEYKDVRLTSGKRLA
jgi:hypothetical protein